MLDYALEATRLLSMLERTVSIIEDLQDGEGYPVIPADIREELNRYNTRSSK